MPFNINKLIETVSFGGSKVSDDSIVSHNTINSFNINYDYEIEAPNVLKVINPSQVLNNEFVSNPNLTYRISVESFLDGGFGSLNLIQKVVTESFTDNVVETPNVLKVINPSQVLNNEFVSNPNLTYRISVESFLDGGFGSLTTRYDQYLKPKSIIDGGTIVEPVVVNEQYVTIPSINEITIEQKYVWNAYLNSLPLISYLIRIDEDRSIMCIENNQITLNAFIAGETSYTAEWEQLMGSSVNIINSDTPNAYYNYSSSDDKKFRFWFNRNQPDEVYRDIWIRHTPTSEQNFSYDKSSYFRDNWNITVNTRQAAVKTPPFSRQIVPNVIGNPAELITYTISDIGGLSPYLNRVEAYYSEITTQEPDILYASYDSVPTEIIVERGVFNFKLFFDLPNNKEVYTTKTLISIPPPPSTNNLTHIVDDIGLSVGAVNITKNLKRYTIKKQSNISLLGGFGRTGRPISVTRYENTSESSTSQLINSFGVQTKNVSVTRNDPSGIGSVI